MFLGGFLPEESKTEVKLNKLWCFEYLIATWVLFTAIYGKFSLKTDFNFVTVRKKLSRVYDYQSMSMLW